MDKWAPKCRAWAPSVNVLTLTQADLPRARAEGGCDLALSGTTTCLQFHSYISTVQSLSGELFISAGEDSRGERRWTRPFKGAGGLGKEELAAWCLFQRCQSPYGREGGRGTGAGLGRVLARATEGSCFLLRLEQRRRPCLARAGGLWLPRSGRAVFSSHSLAQTVTRPGLLQASAWRRLLLASALGCAGGGRETGRQGPRPRADLDPPAQQPWRFGWRERAQECRGRRSGRRGSQGQGE